MILLEMFWIKLKPDYMIMKSSTVVETCVK